MTSRSLFSKLLKEDIKRRIWTIALATLVFFLSLPVASAIIVDRYVERATKKDILNSIIDLIYAQSSILILITIAGAIICGLSSFFYLHSKKKVDLYHSIPVRRETLFAANYLNGLLIYIVPYGINLALCFILLEAKGFMSLSLFNIALSAMVVHFLYYCLIYTLVVIAVMLTGNFIISCFGTGVFLLYGPMIMVIKEMYFSDFFITYYSSNFESKYLFLSPIGNYVNTAQLFDTVLNKKVLSNLMILLAVILIFVVFALFLYKKRPSEAAGKAMAFNISKPVIKFLLVIPITLGGGILFREASYQGRNGWFLFGLIFSFLIVYGVIEIIFNFDIRCAFKYKKQILVNAFAVLILAAIFQFDIFRYDSYIPKENEVKTVSVAISGLEDSVSYYTIEEGYEGYVSYQLRNMKLTNFNTAYELAKEGINVTKEIAEKEEQENSAVYLTGESKETDTKKTFDYYIKYTLKNGKKVYRTYTLYTDDNYASLKAIYNNKEFKEAHYSLNNWEVKDIKTISGNNYMEEKVFSLSDEEKHQLLELYKEELNSLTLEEIKNTYPVAYINFTFDNYNISQGDVYPSFEKTLAFLKEHGLSTGEIMNVNNIISMQLTNNETVKNMANDDSYSQDLEPTTVTITDKEQMEEIYEAVIPNDYYYENRSILDVDSDIDVYITFKQDDYGNQFSNSYYFRKDQIPEFVKEALLKE